ncbi:MAG: GntR family transcriptional regulator [Defluviitaleaceae bacterium]|nr:GntR family transcriptional regulator [Defluviitaleaceae bacterium]MCL2274528.1 GntR family transcriptional regulator [Defluviitaleaceae bacterium]
MRIVLAHQSAIPIYEQIKEQLKASILLGDVAEGDLLPSIRQLARELQVSVITTTRAYNDLELEGFIQTTPGKGCYVKKIDGDLVRAKYLSETKAALKEAVRLGKMAGLDTAKLHTLLNEAE